MTAFLFGVIVGLVLSEFLPADIVYKGKIKNSPNATMQNGKERRGIFRRIFKKKPRV